MDFYAQARPKTDSKKLVLIGKITSLVIIVIAALWAPNIGKFGSLLKYYQEMLSYIAPPVVAAFLLGIFSKRVNGNGAFIGLLSGLAMAVVMLLWRHQIFGDLHFLLIIPILLAFSMAVIYFASLAFPRPGMEKLADTTFSLKDFREEGLALRQGRWYNNYRFWGGCLLAACALILIIFS
jgi:SSS family solute:Na+ symporter